MNFSNIFFLLIIFLAVPVVAIISAKDDSEETGGCATVGMLVIAAIIAIGAKPKNKPDSSSFATKSDLSNKVDKVSGKGLSSEDFTSALLSKLNGIASGATKVTDSTVSGWGYLKTLNHLISNFNNAVTTGFVFSTFQASNIPATNYATGLVINNTSPGNSYVAQLCLDYDANLYTRRRTGSTWTSWKSATMSASQYDQKDILSEEPLTIDQLAAIKPIKFKFKDAETYDDKEHIGGIAEEIEKYMPEGIRLVGGIKYVNYAETAFYMVASLAQVVAQQAADIKALREEIEKLKHK